MIKHILIFISCIAILANCQPASSSSTVNQPDVDSTQVKVGYLDSILARKKLIALTDNSATSYFIYRGQPMGYEYELLSLLANYLNVDLEVKVIHDEDHILDSLEAGIGDIAAANLTITNDRRERVLFTLPHIKTKQVLIQRMPENRYNLTYEQIERALVREPLDLAGKKVYVPLNSSFYERLVNLQSEIGDSIEIIGLPGEIQIDSIMSMISRGVIDYSVTDENVARFYRAFYPNLDVKTPISFSQQIAWALPAHADKLKDTIDFWMSDKKSKSQYAYIYNKYFKWAKQTSSKAKSEYNLAEGGRISPYDNVIKLYAKKMDWPWPLLASLIHQESQFDPDAVSWTGAKGLMQILPETAERFGVDSTQITEPEKNIMAGTMYLKWLYDYWLENLDNDSIQSAKFALASYNAGLGHVKDAQRLAEKYELNSKVWNDNVAEMILNKSKPTYYNDEVVLHGYCRGSEPYSYVKKIYALYDHYQNFLED